MSVLTGKVRAIGESGQVELCDPQDVLEVRALPAGPGNAVVPASVRFLFWQRSGNQARAVRVRHVYRPGTRRNSGRHPRVIFDTTPFSRYELESGPVMGDWMDVAITSTADATDELWETLPQRDRARILNVLKDRL
jgi:hypothetical protein